MSRMLEPISLGYACDVKYQFSRNIFERMYPDGSETEFRNMLFRWQGAPTPFTRHIFDWMIVPRAAVYAYLERDFQGVFEREDLVIDGSTVLHRTLLTYHPHDFANGPDGRLTEAMVDEQYANFRSKYEFLAERFRAHLKTPGPYLYIYKEMLKRDDAERLMALLQQGSPDHRFEILFVDTEGAVNQVLNDPKIHKGWLPPGCAKSSERQWEGQDEAWDKVLNPFNLGLHKDGGALPAEDGTPPEASVEAAVEAPVAPGRTRPPKTGWRELKATPDPSGFLADYAHVDAAGGAGRYWRDGDSHGFDNPEPDDHFFCHFIPAAVAPSGGWARLTLTWPDAAEPRASVALQDQGCRHGIEVSAPRGRSGAEQTLMRLHPGAETLRLVMVPQGAGRSLLPSAIRLEAHEPAREGLGWRGVLSRIGRLVGAA